MRLILIVLAACTTNAHDERIALSALRGNAAVTVQYDGWNLIGNVDTSGSHCESLVPDATAAVDGVPLGLDPATWIGYCGGVRFSGGIAGRTVALSDPTDTWSIALPGFDTSGAPTLEVGALTAGSTTTVAWPGGPPFEGGCVSLRGAKTYSSCDTADLPVRLGPGNSLSFDVPASLTGGIMLDIGVGGWVHVPGVTGAPRGTSACDGPSECNFYLWGHLSRAATVAP
jgi:hypothetical protein